MNKYQPRNSPAHGGKEGRPCEACAGGTRTGAKRLRSPGTPGAQSAHGANTVIGGKVTFLPGAEVVGLPETVMMPKASALPDSDAKSVAQLREDYNTFLGALRAAGILASEVVAE